MYVTIIGYITQLYSIMQSGILHMRVWHVQYGTTAFYLQSGYGLQIWTEALCWITGARIVTYYYIGRIGCQKRRVHQVSWKEKQKRNYENINKGSFSVTGEYDIPILEPVEYKYCDWIGFNYASSVKDRRGKGIHFFLEDYQFTRLLGKYRLLCTNAFQL